MNSPLSKVELLPLHWQQIVCTTKRQFYWEKMGYELRNEQWSYYFSLPWRGTCPNRGHPPRRGGGWLLVLAPGKSSLLSLGKAAWSCLCPVPPWGLWMEPAGTFSRGSCCVGLRGVSSAAKGSELGRGEALNLTHLEKHLLFAMVMQFCCWHSKNTLNFYSLCLHQWQWPWQWHPHRPQHTTPPPLVGVTGSSTQGKDLGQHFYITETLFIFYLYML